MEQQTNLTPKAFLINGEWVSHEQDYFESINPASGQVNYRLSTANHEDVNLAVRTATNAARQSSWRDMLPHARAQILNRMAALITERAEDFARLQMMENGKVWAECKNQAASAAATFRYYAGVCETLGAEVTPSRGNYLSMVAYEPYGVVAAITPWNSPLTMEAQKVAPALAAGNAVILKPSEVTPS
ncbi:MAG: aldehyde dehydrogenase family protein, partial [Advenella sp.]